MRIFDEVQFSKRKVYAILEMFVGVRDESLELQKDTLSVPSHTIDMFL